MENLLKLTTSFPRGGTPLFVYPAACLCTNRYKLSSFAVEGLTYRDVVVLEDVIAASYRFTYDWAPQVGVIKAIKFEGPLSNLKTWTYTLLRYN